MSIFHTLTSAASEITVADWLPAEGSPTDFYKDLLDALNREARSYGWPGVAFKSVRYSGSTRAFSITARPGGKPATLHLLQRHIAETTSNEDASE